MLHVADSGSEGRRSARHDSVPIFMPRIRFFNARSGVEGARR